MLKTISHIRVLLIIILLISSFGFAGEMELIFEAVANQEIDPRYLTAQSESITWLGFPYLGSIDQDGNIVCYDPRTETAYRISNEGQYINKVVFGEGLEKNCKDLMTYTGIDSHNNVWFYIPNFTATLPPEEEDQRGCLVSYNMNGEQVRLSKIGGIPPDGDGRFYWSIMQPDNNIVLTNNSDFLGTYLVNPNGDYIRETLCRNFDYQDNGYQYSWEKKSKNTDGTNRQTYVSRHNSDALASVTTKIHNQQSIIDSEISNTHIDLDDQSVNVRWMGCNEDGQVGFRVIRNSTKDIVGNSEFEYIVQKSYTGRIEEHIAHNWNRPERKSPLVLFARLNDFGEVIIVVSEPIDEWLYVTGGDASETQRTPITRRYFRIYRYQ